MARCLVSASHQRRPPLKPPKLERRPKRPNAPRLRRPLKNPRPSLPMKAPSSRRRCLRLPRGITSSCGGGHDRPLGDVPDGGKCAWSAVSDRPACQRDQRGIAGRGKSLLPSQSPQFSHCADAAGRAAFVCGVGPPIPTWGTEALKPFALERPPEHVGKVIGGHETYLRRRCLRALMRRARRVIFRRLERLAMLPS